MAENKQTIEGAFEALETIIREMESPDISLEDSIRKYEQGVGLIRFCSEAIDRVEKQLIELKAEDEPDDSGDIF